MSWFVVERAADYGLVKRSGEPSSNGSKTNPVVALKDRMGIASGGDNLFTKHNRLWRSVAVIVKGRFRYSFTT